MKLFIPYITLITFALSLYGCEKMSIQKQLDTKFGKYVEEVKPENRKFYEAYDKTLELFGTPYGEVNIKTSFGNAHVVVSGPESAEAVVLLHGMNASSTMWYPNIKALAKNHRVYAIDYLLEPGKSEQNGKVKNLDEILNWYDEIFTGLKLEEFSLIGASSGGWMAVYIALRPKYKIMNMILLSPAQTFTPIHPESDVLTNILYTLNPRRKNLRNVLETMSVNVDNIKQAYIDQYFIATQKASLNKFILQMTTFSDDELRTLNMPVLILIGDQDIMNDEKSIDRAKELLPHAYTGIIENAGHFLTFDQSDIVNAKMLEFLSIKNPVKKN
ncbi:MAG: alpha/beta hydrolase [Bacteroidales bacterium]|nr:alpha/beta hydrolase [Bacteroidales bacterium]